jgi:predicted phosphodiesterase
MRVVTDDDPIEPNEIADTYQALSEYHQLVSRLAAAYEGLTGETESTLHIFSDLIGDKRAEFGEVTATRNTFTMEEYRETFGEELPTISTDGLTPTEREPLEQLGIIDHEETFRLPCHPRTGERLHIWPLSGGLNPDYDLLENFTVPSEAVTLFHISDTHLGYQNRVKTGGGGKTKWVSRADSVSSFQAVLQQAIKEEIDAIVHTGDLFDHDVDQDTLQTAVSSIEGLAEYGIKFYYILGDHDRLATGGDIPLAANAVRALNELSRAGAARHCTTTGTQLGESAVTLFGIDAAGIGFSGIYEGYTLSGWSPDDLSLDAPQTSGPNILCLHESLEAPQIAEVIEAANHQDYALDLILLGHEHSPPFDTEWQTEINGVPIACAGPTIPISKYFDEHPPGYNRVRIGSSGNLGVDRRELAE